MENQKTNNNVDILVVEDSVLQATYLRRELTQKGYTVAVKGNGAEALSVMHEIKPKLVISDIHMPVMNGYEMCYKMKHDETLEDIPVILLTEYSDLEDIIKGINAKADNYVTKSYDEEFLLTKIEDLLKLKDYPSKSMEDGIEVYLSGKIHIVKNFDLRQILILLISIYDNAIQQHKELEKQTEELQASEERYREMLERTLSGYYRATLDGEFLELNPAYLKIFGYKHKEELLNVDIPSTLYPSHEDYESYVEKLKSEDALQNHVVYLRKKDGSEVIVEENVRLVKDDYGEVLYFEGFVNDITTRINTEKMIRRKAFYDTLTGIPNRILFIDRVDHALAYAGRYKEEMAILFLDLDGFKQVNDTYGHQIGDELLKGVAQRLTNCLRKSDTVARLGGDEFAVLLPDIKQSGTGKWHSINVIVQKVIRSFNQPWNIGEHQCLVTASIGIAMYPQNGKDAQTLIKNADTAMYYAKARGKNNYKLYSPSMDMEAS